MASALEALASGLRGAGGILSPDVQRLDQQDRARNEQAAEQRRNMLAQLTIRGAEAGSIDPVKATETLKGLGIEVPEGAIGPTPEALARKQSLENEMGFRREFNPNGALLDNANIAAKYGKPELAMQMFNHEQTRIANQQMRVDALEERKRQFDLMRDDKSKSLEQQAELARMADETKKLIAVQTAAVQRQGQDFRSAMLEFQMKDKADKDLQSRTMKLQGALEKANLPEADSTLGAAEKLINPRTAQFLTGPGMKLADRAIPEEARKARQAFAKVFNIELKRRSGAAVTDQELDRLRKEFGAGVWQTPQQVMDAMTQARDAVQRHYISVAAGFGPDALKNYNDFVRGYGGSIVLDDSPKSQGVVNFGDLE